MRALKRIDRAVFGPSVPRAAGPFHVENDRVQHTDGSLSAVLATEDLDVLALDPARHASAVAAFSRLCRTLDTPLQLVIRVRRAGSDEPDARATEGMQAWDEAMREHWRARLDESSAHTRSVLVAVRAPSNERLDAAVAQVAACMQTIGSACTRLDNGPLRAALSPAGADGLASWYVHPQHAVIAGTHLRGYAMRRLPGHAVATGWLAPLLAVPVECDIAIHLTPVALGDALQTLGHRLRGFAAHRLLEAERGVVGDVHVDIGIDSAFELRGRLARNVGAPLLLSIGACVAAPSLQELQRRSALLRSGFEAAMLSVEPTHFRHLSAALSCLPLARDGLGMGKLVESDAAATCIPWLEARCNDPDGYRLGATLASGEQVKLAPFDTRLHANANIAVFASSGHGKSFALGSLVIEALTHGIDAVIVDPEGEYEHVVRAVDGTYTRLAPGGDCSLNVFDAAGDDSEEAVAAATTLITLMCGGALDDVRRAHVDDACRAAQQTAAAQGRVALLHDCIEPLGAAPDVAAVVRRYCRGGLGTLFSRPTSFHLGSRVTGISLIDMPGEHMAAAAFLVARWLWDLIRDRRRRHIVFDEVGALCLHASLLTLLVQLARRCRKYGASLVVATQNAQDLLGTDAGRVVATNCAMVLLGGHRAAETEAMAEAFGLTPEQRRLVETSARGEFLLTAGTRRLGIRVEVPEMHRRALTTTP